ncbi:P-loop ATPase, Sll1717 family [Kribbella sp. NPDC051620]|uniref:P-loop ATPase, Sll1717 family n=1 Tax=Kribbella sp. NPDC051620 TaxID=3364120 RepID=UPI0037A80D63
MTEPPALHRLHFGYEDAERDIASGLLRESFISTPAYEAVMSGRKMLVIGRKGVGKSAICLRLAAEHAGGTIFITPDDALGSEIRRFELQGLTGDTAKALVWRYIFAVHAARHLVLNAQRARRSLRKPKSIRVLRRFLKANGELPNQDAAGKLAHAVSGLQKTSLSLEAFGIKTGLELGRVPSEGAQASRQLEVVERGVADAFAELDQAGRTASVLLLADQLEQVWSSEPDAHSMIIGLLLAAKHVTAYYGGAMRCLVFLRSDIYDSLSFPDGDKFRGDELRLGWSDDALMELALARARTSAGAGLTSEQLWTELFPARVGEQATTEFVLSRALPRPRDLIQYLNLARDIAVHGGQSRMREQDVLLATRQFSEWKLKDLTQEYLVAYPYLERLFPLFQNMGYVVMRDVLATRLDRTAGTLHAQFPAYQHSFTLPGIVDTLYSVGFLGVRRGNDVVYAGGADLPVQPYEAEFHIHPCFRESLGATNAVDIHAYTPLVLTAIHGQVAGGNVRTSTPRAATRDRGYRLLKALDRSCHTILNQIGRAVDLPMDTRNEIATQVSRIMRNTREASDAQRDGRRIDVDDHVLAAATYLEALAAQLLASGLTGIDDVSARIAGEARHLIASVGGSSGSSGDSRS